MHLFFITPKACYQEITKPSVLVPTPENSKSQLYICYKALILEDSFQNLLRESVTISRVIQFQVIQFMEIQATRLCVRCYYENENILKAVYESTFCSWHSQIVEDKCSLTPVWANSCFWVCCKTQRWLEDSSTLSNGKAKRVISFWHLSLIIR